MCNHDEFYKSRILDQGMHNSGDNGQQFTMHLAPGRLPFSYPFVEGAPTSTNSKPHQNAKDHTPHTKNLQ